jgi:hypothetical protein
VRVLGPAEAGAAAAFLAAGDPVVDVFVDYRIRSTGLDPRALAGEVWGYYEEDRLTALCHAGANLVPAQASERALHHFARRALDQGRRCATIVGPRESVQTLWSLLRPDWGPAREERWDQPHLQIDHAPIVSPDPLVRRATPADLDVVYPAAVAMYTEEVGVSPEVGGGGDFYRARVAQLIARGWSFVRRDAGRVVFKAEVASVTPYACQIQGVYVAPDRRGEGLAVAGMAAVVDIALREIAPVVALYANAHNVAAIRAYERAGFRQTETFATVMF